VMILTCHFYQISDLSRHHILIHTLLKSQIISFNQKKIIKVAYSTFKNTRGGVPQLLQKANFEAPPNRTPPGIFNSRVTIFSDQNVKFKKKTFEVLIIILDTIHFIMILLP